MTRTGPSAALCFHPTDRSRWSCGLDDPGGDTVADGGHSRGHTHTPLRAVPVVRDEGDSDIHPIHLFPQRRRSGDELPNAPLPPSNPTSGLFLCRLSVHTGLITKHLWNVGTSQTPQACPHTARPAPPHGHHPLFTKAVQARALRDTVMAHGRHAPSMSSSTCRQRPV